MNALSQIISGMGLVQTVIYLIVAGVVFGLLLWLIDYCKTPEPFNRIAKIVVAIAIVLFIINILLSLAGHPIVSWP